MRRIKFVGELFSSKERATDALDKCDVRSDMQRRINSLSEAVYSWHGAQLTL